MSNEMLSQDEIDALLRGSSLDNELSSEENKLPPLADYFSEIEEDTLGEIGNISFGSSATALSALLNQKVEITTPHVSLIFHKDLASEFPKPYVAIEVKYTEGFSGSNLLVIKQSDAAIIADLMLGGDGTSTSELMDEIQLSAVQEAMNQMMGSAATSMSTIFSKKVDISPPSIELLNLVEGSGTHAIPSDDILVKSSFRLKIGDLIDSNIMQLLQLPFAKKLVEDLLNPSENPSEPSYTKTASDTRASQQEIPVIPQQSYQEVKEPVQAVSQQYANYPPVNQPAQQSIGSQPINQPAHSVDIQPASFSSFEDKHLLEKETRNLDMLLDIPLQVTVELGRTKRTVKEVLELSSGSIIELDKLAGEPVDILLNNKLIAKGEVVVIEENFGVRVTDIVSQKDRISNLN
ncbi:flagellar motor switch phosphatase FliY [Priestia abyssalis]|uniref:flagellar motor switch phosphatase FliY n=1 Tax=Priestia abyssalis TaxID=1221450 RepID=UPI000995ABD2|nr:flagellar motor switch phosphatase FliY [Priestia abyssalis]